MTFLKNVEQIAYCQPVAMMLSTQIFFSRDDNDKYNKRVRLLPIFKLNVHSKYILY